MEYFGNLGTTLVCVTFYLFFSAEQDSILMVSAHTDVVAQDILNDVQSE